MSDKIPMPGVKNIFRDRKRNFTLEIYAYRKLSREEILQFVSLCMRQNGWSSIPRNKKCKCYTTIE